MGAFAGAVLPWMADAGPRWIVGSSLIGFALVTWFTLHVGFEASDNLTELSEMSFAASLLFDPATGLVPIVSAFTVGGLVVDYFRLTP